MVVRGVLCVVGVRTLGGAQDLLLLTLQASPERWSPCVPGSWGCRVVTVWEPHGPDRLQA